MIEIVTGKTWRVSAQRLLSGYAVPFVSGDTLRAQLRDTPAGAVLAEITAAITVSTEGRYEMELTDEETAELPTASQFGAVKIIWLDVDIIRGDEVIPTIVNEKVYARAGVTKEVV